MALLKRNGVDLQWITDRRIFSSRQNVLAAAAAGVYGLVSYEVTQRTHEIGVRVALGASSSTIMRMITGFGLRVVGAGLLGGIACALALGRVIGALLFETSPYDPGVLGVTCAAIVIAALAASVMPAWRAAGVDPGVALRAE
jgi:putative ABC transport system permease protein